LKRLQAVNSTITLQGTFGQASPQAVSGPNALQSGVSFVVTSAITGAYQLCVFINLFTCTAMPYIFAPQCSHCRQCVFFAIFLAGRKPRAVHINHTAAERLCQHRSGATHSTATIYNSHWPFNRRAASASEHRRLVYTRRITVVWHVHHPIRRHLQIPKFGCGWYIRRGRLLAIPRRCLL
jgi:hypothetical protein